MRKNFKKDYIKILYDDGSTFKATGIRKFYIDKKGKSTFKVHASGLCGEIVLNKGGYGFKSKPKTVHEMPHLEYSTWTGELLQTFSIPLENIAAVEVFQDRVYTVYHLKPCAKVDINLSKRKKS